MITPYTPFRIPSRDAVAIPLNAPPPAPRTPITANCDAPENVRSDNKHVCRSEKPFAKWEEKFKINAGSKKGRS
jgi:hypothetical protein